jgi:hypothetical protein
MQVFAFPRSVPGDPNDDMKLRQEDQQWLNDEILRAVNASKADLLRSLKPSGARRVMLWLKEWGAISAIWAVPLALVGMVITLAIFAFNGSTKNAAFQSASQEHLGTIDGRLNKIDIELGEISKQLQNQRYEGVLRADSGASPKAVGEAADGL